MVYGVLGRTLSHSFSPGYFARKFTSLNLQHVYNAYELADIAQLPELLKENPQFAGLNVTIPYKESIIPYLHALSAEAQAIGAVNTVRFSPDGRLTGHNTDWIGFRDALAEQWQPKGPFRALILGTGGSSKAVAYALGQMPLCSQVHFATRHTTLATHIPYAFITPDVLREYALVVNCTPLGMYPDTAQMPGLPTEGMHAGQHFFDLVYNPAETLLLRTARTQGASVQNGLRMLELQADAAWAIWQS